MLLPIGGELHYHEALGGDIFRIGDLPLLSLPFLRRTAVRCKIFLFSFCFVAATAFAQQPRDRPLAGNQSRQCASAAQVPAEPTLPYIPSLDVTAMDRSVDPCVDFYQLLLRWLAAEEPHSRRPGPLGRLFEAVRG